MNGYDLKRLLDRMSPEELQIPLVVRGYESGVNDLERLSSIWIKPKYYWEQYDPKNESCGIFGQHAELYHRDDEPNSVQALWLKGTGE